MKNSLFPWEENAEGDGPEKAIFTSDKISLVKIK